MEEVKALKGYIKERAEEVGEEQGRDIRPRPTMRKH